MKLSKDVMYKRSIGFKRKKMTIHAISGQYQIIWYDFIHNGFNAIT